MSRLVVLLVLFVICGDHRCYYRGEAGTALKLEAIEAVCNASKKLKGLFSYCAEKLGKADRFFEEIRLLQRLLRLKLLSEWKKGEMCGTMRVFLTNVRPKERNMKRDVAALWKTGRRLVGEAGIAAGRLDEMVSIFAQAYGNDTKTATCIGGVDRNPKEVLKNCFTKNPVSQEWESLKITEGGKVFDNEFERKLDDTLNVLLSLGSRADPRHEFGVGGKCQLTHGAAGGGYMKSSNLTENILWGDGVLGIGSHGQGRTASKGSTRRRKYHHDVVWEENPAKSNPTLRRVIKEFAGFEEIYERVEAAHRHLVDAFLQEKLYVEHFKPLALREVKRRFTFTLGSHSSKQGTASGGIGSDENELSMFEWLSKVNGGIVEEKLLKEEMKDC